MVGICECQCLPPWRVDWYYAAKICKICWEFMAHGLSWSVPLVRRVSVLTSFACDKEPVSVFHGHWILGRSESKSVADSWFNGVENRSRSDDRGCKGEEGKKKGEKKKKNKEKIKKKGVVRGLTKTFTGARLKEKHSNIKHLRQVKTLGGGGGVSWEARV